VLMPAVITGAGVLVRVGVAHLTGRPVTPDDIASVLVRAVPWAFFVASVRFGTNSLVANPSLVTKIAFPKEVFPLAAVLSCGVDFLVAAAVVVGVLLLMGWSPGPEALWAIPLLAVMALLATGVVLMLSALNLFFRDVKYIVEVFLTYAIFVTPVLFPSSFAGEWEHVVLLNPLAPLLEGLSAVMVGHAAPLGPWIAYSVACTTLSLVAGYSVFKWLESQFAERI
jgi:lipopolysaccharide transport system permease protein